MPLSPGSHLGPYEVLALIGAGGMGEVYRARDPRLNREVAIKVLPADRLGDADRRRRFVQEAHAASALNHPHIITIHEIETADGNDFIVMEYVRGKSVDALIPRHGMRLGEVLRIAIPVADALAAAHARGIIHRDLKPANVMVGTDGAVKVLDFGLAKLTGREDADEADLTHTADVALSVPGTIAGTAPYMSPEQATGAKVDARSDIFSFGAMLYEMVTGIRPFVGHSTTDTLDAVVRAQPKVPSALVPGVPSDLDKVILRCLRKDPERRFQHMGDVKVALQEIKEQSESGPAVAVSSVRQRIMRLVGVLGAAAALLAAVATWRLWSRPQPENPSLRVVPLTTLKGTVNNPTFSPDGEQVAFDWAGEKDDNVDVYVTIIGSPEIRRLTTDPAGDTRPSWSPDGRQIAFLREHPDGATIQLVSPLGGADRRLSDFRQAESVNWSPDSHSLVVARRDHAQAAEPGGVYLIPVQGGTPRLLIATKPHVVASYPAFSPDGRRLAYLTCNAIDAYAWLTGCDVYALDLDTALVPTTAPRRLTTQSAGSAGGITWTHDAMSVVYSAATAAQPLPRLWRVGIDANRPAELIDLAGPGASVPAIARSRDRLAFTQFSLDVDIYRFEAGRSGQSVVASTVAELEVRISPDGRQFAFTSSMRSADRREEIWMAGIDGSGVQQVTHGPGQAQGSSTWSPDGRRLAFESLADDGHAHIWVIDADGGMPRRLTDETGDQNVPVWSHDGRWIYHSGDDGSGSDRSIWRVPASGGSPERLIRGASSYLTPESPDGTSLYYQPKDADSPLLAFSLSGRSTRQLIACVEQTAFATGPQGVYYVPCGQRGESSLHVMNPTTGEDRVLGTLDGLQQRSLGLAVSPDGHTILYPREIRSGADLMLIENFR